MNGSSISYIRKDMLPQKAPPSSQTGAIKWMRENLFSGWFNTILTLVGFYVTYAIVAASLPWLLNGVWNANSLTECREIIAANAGEGASGACWALIRARWHQFLFGFFPMDIYWRPVLAFGLLFSALSPVLYFGLKRPNMLLIGISGALTLLAMIGVSTDAMHLAIAAAIIVALLVVANIAPKKLVWFTALYPFIGFYLLWGGSIWGPIGVLAGFVILAVVWMFAKDRFGVVVGAAIGFLIACVWWLGIQTTVTTQLHGLMPIGLREVNSDQFGGFLLSFVIGVTAISASLPMGLILALGRRSDMLLIKTLSVGFIEFIRGVPLITMLFTASLLLQYFLPPQTNFDLILRVIILVTFFASAYIAEVIRGGLAALPKGQGEAADALGLDYWQAQQLIIMPQALKIAIPGIVSSFIGLFKDTTLVALVGLADPLQGITKIVRADINWKGVYWEPFLFVGIIFFLVCFGMSRYSMYLENKLKTDHR